MTYEEKTKLLNILNKAKAEDRSIRTGSTVSVLIKIIDQLITSHIEHDDKVAILEDKVNQLEAKRVK